MSAAPLLSVRDLTLRVRTPRGPLAAVEGLSFDVPRAGALAVVGESGCGKSVTARALARLLPEPPWSLDPSSRVLLDGQDLARADERALRRVRGARIGMVFQEPLTALDPVMAVGAQLDEALRAHSGLGRRARRERALALLAAVELPDAARRLRDFPHRLSGGMRQRVALAAALACEPDLLVADEPTTALDPTVQAQVLALLARARAERGAALLLVTHDLAVAAQACERMLVLYAGRAVEEGPLRELVRAPRHPYTRALLEASPRPGAPRALSPLPGSVPALGRHPSGCRFRERCPLAEARCAEEEPALEARGARDRRVRCHFPLDGQGDGAGGGA